MRYKEFKEVVLENIKNRLGEKYEVTLHDVLKNNSVRFAGLVIRKSIEGISPTIYLEAFYEKYKEGQTIENICDEIIRIYHESDAGSPDDFRFFSDYEKVRPNLCLKLINLTDNRKLLKDVPYLSFMDLAAVPYCLVDNKKIGCASILIHNAHVENWKMDIASVLNDAKENTRKRLGAEITSIVDALIEIEPEYANSFDCIPKPQMYILSNKSRSFGAVNIIYDDILKKFAEEEKSDFYILPSSVHEVLLVAVQSPDEWEGYDAMVKEVNKTSVSKEEVLSDHAYYYCRESGILKGNHE